MSTNRSADRQGSTIIEAVISPNSTRAEVEPWVEGIVGRFLPLFVAGFCLIAVTILISIGLDRPLVLTLGGIWLAMALLLFWNALRNRDVKTIPLEPDSEIVKCLGSEFLEEVKVGTLIQSAKNLHKIGISKDHAVAIDADLLSELSPSVAAKVIQLTYKARVFSFMSFIYAIFLLWPAICLITFLHLKTLPAFLYYFELFIGVFPAIVLYSLLDQYINRKPILVRSENDLNSLQEAQAFLESQPLPKLFPIIGWTKFKVWFSGQIVRRESRRYKRLSIKKS